MSRTRNASPAPSAATRVPPPPRQAPDPAPKLASELLHLFTIGAGELAPKHRLEVLLRLRGNRLVRRTEQFPGARLAGRGQDVAEHTRFQTLLQRPRLEPLQQPHQRGLHP